MTDVAIGPYAPRVDGASDGRLPSRPSRVDPGLPNVGVYGSRPLAPLDEAVADAIGLSPREESGRGELEIETLWKGPELRARLVQVLADHAARSGAARVVAADHPSLGLAGPVAAVLGTSLTRWRGDGASPSGRRSREPGKGGGAYLVACVLQEREAARFLRPPAGGRRVAGIGTVIRIEAPDGPPSTDDHNLMSIIDL